MAKKMLVVGLVLLMVLTVVLGCAKPAPEPPPAPPPEEKVAPPPEEAVAPPPPKKLVIALAHEPKGLEAMLGERPPGASVMYNMYEWLIARDKSGKLVPGLCETWTVSPDGKEMYFTLRKGVKFHSGDPLTATDVKWSYLRQHAHPKAKRYVVSVESCEIIDDYHFVLHFTEPSTEFLPNLGFPIGSKIYYRRVGAEEFASNPVGTGPYKFVAHRAGEYIDVEAYEDYWGGAPSVKEARFVFATEDTTRVAMLKTGEADIILQVPYPLVEDVEGTPGLKTEHIFVEGLNCFLGFPNYNKDAPWYDKRVRQAIAHAIDREAIVNDLFKGLPASYPGLAPWEVGYDPDLKHWSYDPEKAKALLAEAGYADGFAMPVYYMIGKAAGLKETVEAVTLYLNAVDIEVEIRPVEILAFVGNVSPNFKKPDCDFTLMLAGPLAGHPEPLGALKISFSLDFRHAFWGDPEVDALIKEGLTILDDTKRGKLTKQVVRKLHDDLAYIPIWNTNLYYGMKDNIDYIPTAGMYEPMLLKDVKVK